MIAMLVAGAQRITRLLGTFTMYRLVLLALSVLAVYALVVSFAGLIVPSPLELAATFAVLAVVIGAVDLVAHRVIGRAWRLDSSLITALILLFVVRPGVEMDQLLGAVIAGAAAAVSKYLLAVRGRHIFNPAAVGATVATLSGISASAWWVGNAVMAVPVIVLGLAVLWRATRIRLALVFLAVVFVIAYTKLYLQLVASATSLPLSTVVTAVTVQSPFLFLALFMLSEPLTLPARGWQRAIVALVTAVFAGWAPVIGTFSLGQERALLIGNLVGFLFAIRTGRALTLVNRRQLTPRAVEATFQVKGPFRFTPGQYVELEVSHPRQDGRGNRREFSLVSAPSELPLIRVAYRADETMRMSSFKKALNIRENGSRAHATGVWGDFVLPRNPSQPLLLIAAGIGVTPFVSQLKHLTTIGEKRDIVLVYVASTSEELAYLDELAASGARILVVTRDEPADLPENAEWTGGQRLSAETLEALVPDLSRRHAAISGPPRLIAELAPTLRKARAVHTDAFAGY